MAHADPRPTIEIIDWSEHYETAETKKLRQLRWVPVPNIAKRGYMKLMHRHGYTGLGVWLAILQVASRKHKDQRDGTLDYTLEDLALETRGNLPELQEILPTLQRIGWIRLNLPASAGPAAIAGESADEGKGRKEGKGREGRGGTAASALTPIESIRQAWERLTGEWSFAGDGDVREATSRLSAIVARDGLSAVLGSLETWHAGTYANGTRARVWDFLRVMETPAGRAAAGTPPPDEDEYEARMMREDG